MTLVPLIDAAACSSHGDCEDIAPEIFRLEDIAVVVGDGPDELMLAAAQACPSIAIRLVDGDSGRQVYP
ncbi:MAG TPA: ferredoxin [Solirubrobacteraceae bacterium]|jgi:ferredoxin|nr:ferredoxin [Solirubrobacteraceae bacterium]